MIKKITGFVLLITALSSTITAQNIEMTFPAFAGKTYDFIIFQGSKQLTVQQDTIPANGKFVLQVPQEYAPYTGMCRWLISGTAEGGGLDMAIPGYDFSVRCDAKQPTNENISYTGFDAVNELNRLHTAQQLILDKFETMSRAAQLYKDVPELHENFNAEKEKQAIAYEVFQNSLKKNDNFNARFLPIVNLTKGIPHKLTDDYELKASLVNEFITEELNFEDFYVSGHWTGIIQSWVVLQINVVNDSTKFASDFKQISKRIQSPDHYTDFAGKVTYYLTQYGKDSYVEAIAKTVLNSGKITEYLGSLAVYKKAMIGMQAPDIILTEHIGNLEDHNHQTKTVASNTLVKEGFNYSLLLFYESGCGPCQQTIEDLNTNYKDLVAEGISIIAYAADTDPEDFNFTKETLAWKDSTFCDFKGMKGVNFTNYGVIGTPTMYIINKQGVIVKKIGNVKELLTWAETVSAGL